MLEDLVERKLLTLLLHDTCKEHKAVRAYVYTLMRRQAARKFVVKKPIITFNTYEPNSKTKSA